MKKKDLQQILWIKKNIANLEERIFELETYATKCTTQITDDHFATQQQPGKLGGIVAKIVDMQNEINKKLEQKYEIIKQVEAAIKKLPEREAYLIRQRYIKGVSWEQIAVDMDYSWRQIHNIHSRALKMIGRKCLH